MSTRPAGMARGATLARLLRRGAVLGLVLGAAVAAGGCSSTRTTDDSPAVEALADEPGRAAEIGSVVVIGDSLTEGSSAAIAEALPAAGYEALLIDGVSSRRTTVSSDGGPSSGIEAIEEALTSGAQPDAWVVALGTNDVRQYASSDEYALVIAELMAALPADAPVVWLDVYLRDSAEESEAFNALLHQQLDDRPNAVVADWHDRADDDGVLRDDGIHPSDEGHVAFAATIVAGLDALLAGESAGG